MPLNNPPITKKEFDTIVGGIFGFPKHHGVTWMHMMGPWHTLRLRRARKINPHLVIRKKR